MSKVGSRIKERRLACGLTLLEVAENIGVSEATVQRYESGLIKNIPHEKISAISDVFHCSPSYIMGWVDDWGREQNPVKRIDSINPHILTHSEDAHLEKYRMLNNEGRYRVDGYTEDLVASGKYKKGAVLARGTG
jgi:transcriptional regulator with XRE-family HTH domain